MPFSDPSTPLPTPCPSSSSSLSAAVCSELANISGPLVSGEGIPRKLPLHHPAALPKQVLLHTLYCLYQHGTAHCVCSVCVC